MLLVDTKTKEIREILRVDVHVEFRHFGLQRWRAYNGRRRSVPKLTEKIRAFMH